MKKQERVLEFDPLAIEDLQWWVRHNKKKALRILHMALEASRDPFAGTGKPEPLKYELSGCWSRRIDHEHRLVYEVQEKKIRILCCRYHY